MSTPQLAYYHVPFFSAQALERRYPEWHGTSFVVAQSGSDRAVVQDVSPLAWAKGLRPGLRVADAVSRWAVMVQPFDTAAEVDLLGRLEELAHGFSPWVTVMTHGLAVDFRGSRRMFGSALQGALRLRASMEHELGIQLGLAMAGTVEVARMALAVTGPGGFIIVPIGNETQFLAKQGIEVLPEVDTPFITMCQSLGLETLADIAGLDRQQALHVLGSRGLELRNLARGETPSLRERHRPRNLMVSREIFFAEDSANPDLVRAQAGNLLVDAAREMRARHLLCGEVRLVLTYTDGLRRQATSSHCPALKLDTDMLVVIGTLCLRLQERRVRIRRVQVLLAHLIPDPQQEDFFLSDGEQRLRSWQKALDGLGRRFGSLGPRPLSTWLGKN